MGDPEHVDADSRDCCHRPPLALGAEWGHIDVMAMLLEQYDINTKFVEVNSCTFLSHSSAVWCRDAIL